MNTREAMKALLEGKKLINVDRASTDGVLWLNVHGHLECAHWGTQVTLCNLAYKLYEEPNPHTLGTFAWAREEAARGQLVRRPVHRNRSSNKLWRGFNKYAFESTEAVKIEDVDATDWEIG